VKRHHLLLLLLALLAGLIIALLSHSVVSSAPLRITATPSPTPPPTATARTPTPQPAAVTYVVQRGDTLFAIGRRFGVNPYDIARANNIVNPGLIRVGQRLIIPTGGGSPIVPTPTPVPAPTFPPFPTPTINDVPAAFQPFERGLMIWRGDRKRIWIAACCTSTIPLGGRWLSFEDAFVDGMPESDPSIVPPGGLYQPVRGFGLVWRTLRDYSYGGTVRDLLGWATAPEQGYTARLEYRPGGFFDPEGHFIGRPGTWTINTPDNKRYYFHEAGPAWSLIEP